MLPGTRRHVIAFAIVATSALAAAPAALASSMTVTAPASVPEQSKITVHVSGSVDEFELDWAAFVQNEACPATFQEADRQPNTVKQNRRQFIQQGPFEFDSDLDPSTGRQPPFTPLHGTVNVCSYIYHEFTPDQATVATAVNAVGLIPPGASSPFQFFPRMTSNGEIRLAATCARGCALKAVFGRAGTSRTRTVTRTLPARSTPASVLLKLDAKTAKLVRLIRKKHRGGPVKVQVKVTATPPSGAPLHETRVVKVV
jgi:hypothetical protein